MELPVTITKHDVLDLVTMTGWMLGTRIVLAASTTQEYARLMESLSEMLPKYQIANATLLQRGQLAAYRASKLIPGASCLHRAGAAQCWFAIRGVPAKLVVGFRKRASIEGHAWLEVQTDSGTVSLFVDDPDGFEATWIPA